MRRRSITVFGWIAACWVLMIAGPGFGAGLMMAGSPVELVISSVSERTVKVELVPLDGEGKGKALPASHVLAAFESREVFRAREAAGVKDLMVGKLRVTVSGMPLKIVVREPVAGAAVSRVVQEMVMNERDGSVVFETAAPVFGLGEGREQFDRRGHYYNFVNGQTTFLATNGATIPVPLLIGADGWGLFFHNPPQSIADPRQANMPWCTFDLRGADAGPPPVEERAPPSNNPVNATMETPAVLPKRGKFIPRAATLGQGPIQIYVMALSKPADALEEMTRLTGHAAMPPKWVMGYMQSHRSLDLGEPVKIVETFREKKLPLDAVIYLGTGYTVGDTGWNLGHGSLEFNPKVFDKPVEIVDRLHALNVKIVLHENNVPPGIFGESVNEKSNDPIHISNYWGKHVPLVKMGVDGWWPDDGDNVPIEGRFVRQQLYYEGSLRDRPNERPWTLNRNSYAGASKFGGWIWSGDVQSRWVTLKNHVATGLNASVSVTPFWGTDTGGFFLPPATSTFANDYTGELYARWFEFSAFNPLFRSHGRNWHLHLPWGWDTGEIGPKEQGTTVNYPPESELHNTEVEGICRKYLELRYALLPYNYSIVREACDTGMPPMRALWLMHPGEGEAVKVADEYMWGPEILVAPVVEKGAGVRKLYLPKGQWIDWWTGETQSGEKWIERKVDLATMPLYVKAGAIVPMDPVRQWTGEAVDEPTTLRIYPGGDGEFVLYDDDGHTQGYLNGGDAQMNWIRVASKGGVVTLEKDARMKAWPAGLVRILKVQRGVAGTAQKVTFRGEKVELKID